ncbi:hypothetical protein [Sigmofec virus UA08Rod_6251]|uniref:Uncharacterized protein n=1 Tax=Sigmofec virus UA08Rod_6251 TaxID=2929226 RepID=A0A976N108_9VIRU|nr:hypothetical protein [Sigmofec virus UA08Rod_6251]
MDVLVLELIFLGLVILVIKVLVLDFLLDRKEVILCVDIVLAVVFVDVMVVVEDFLHVVE